MKDFRKFDEYKITEAEIEKALHILSVADPENATRENAIGFLEHMWSRVHSLTHVKTTDELIKIYHEYAKSRPKSIN